MAKDSLKNIYLGHKIVKKFDRRETFFASSSFVLFLIFFTGVSLSPINSSTHAKTPLEKQSTSLSYDRAKSAHTCLGLFKKSPRLDIAEQKKIFLEQVEHERYLGRHSHTHMRITSRRSIDMSLQLMATTTKKTVELAEDKWAIPIVKSNLVRSNSTEHTVARNIYIERHFSRELMKLLAADTSIKVDVIAATLEETFSHLKSESFDQIEILPQKLRTDFTLILALNSKTGEIRLAISILNGEAFKQKVVSQLLYYTPNDPQLQAIQFQRIRVLTNQMRPKDIFTKLLKKENINPDVVFFGYKTSFAKMTESMDITLIKEDDGRDLAYSVYNAHGYIVMSVNIKPQLFADRAGELVEAVQSLSTKKRSFVMLGTAGALSSAIPFNSYVAPSHVRFVQGAKINRIDYENKAAGLDLQFKGEPKRFFFGNNIGQMSVNSILFEDMKWARLYSEQHNPDKGDSLVEQEGYGIIKAAKRKGDHLLMLYRISDLPLGNEDLATTALRLMQDAELENVQKALLEMAIRNITP